MSSRQEYINVQHLNPYILQTSQIHTTMRTILIMTAIFVISIVPYQVNNNDNGSSYVRAIKWCCISWYISYNRPWTDIPKYQSSFRVNLLLQAYECKCLCLGEVSNLCRPYSSKVSQITGMSTKAWKNKQIFTCLQKSKLILANIIMSL